jgi:tetratricopeptide (TPR) repeat protein
MQVKAQARLSRVPERPLTLQDLIRTHQTGVFVGRESQLARFEENLRLPVTDPRRRFLFTVHGAAGIGKSFLVKQFRRIATEHGLATGEVGEPVTDVPDALASLAADLGPCKEFTKRLTAYRKYYQTLDADPTIPKGLWSLVTRSTVRLGVAAAGEIPVVGAAAKAVDPKSAAEDVDKLRVLLFRKLRSRDDVRLVMFPTEVLTRALLSDLNTLKRPLALFFDAYERTSSVLDQWLRDLLDGKYGALPADVVFVLSGHHRLDLNDWNAYYSICVDLPLDTFTEDEARHYLTSHGVTEEPVIEIILGLSGRLPRLVAMLTASQPKDVTAGSDPRSSAVEQFLNWEPDPQRQLAALYGALPRRLSPEVFTVVAGTDENLQWLLQQPFVSEQEDGFRYHDAVRTQMLRILRRRSPSEWRLRHLNLGDYYNSILTKNKLGSVDCLSAAALEQAYHDLCADRIAALPNALWGLITAFSVDRPRLPQWFQMLVQAGHETETVDIVRSGTELAEAVDEAALLELLVEDQSIPPTVRALAHYERAILDRAQSNFDAALAEFERAIHLAPDEVRYIGQRGETLRCMGRPTEAVADLDHLLTKKPNTGWAYGSRGAARQALGLLDASLEDLNKAIGLRCTHAQAFATRAETLRRLGRLPEALTDAERAIELSPDYLYGLKCRAATLLDMGQSTQAADAFKQVIRQSSRHIDWTLRQLAQSNLRTDDAFKVLLNEDVLNRYDWPNRGVLKYILGYSASATLYFRQYIDHSITAEIVADKFHWLHEVSGIDIDAVLDILGQLEPPVATQREI